MPRSNRRISAIFLGGMQVAFQGRTGAARTAAARGRGKDVTGGPNVLILGIGNLLWADEGFGVRAVEALHRDFAFPDHVRLLDGGTQGIYLIQLVREADV